MAQNQLSPLLLASKRREGRSEKQAEIYVCCIKDLKRYTGFRSLGVGQIKL